MSIASAIMVTAMGIHAPSVEAKTLKLSSKKVTLTVGKSKTIKVKGAKKVTWKVAWGNTSIRLAGKKRTSVKIVAKKEGNAKIQAKAGKKKVSCRVTVRPKTTILNVTKVDKATVKKVHETLSKGNNLKIRISKGTKSQRLKTMDKLGIAVSKYNEYGVRPQLYSAQDKGSYTEWEADKELAGQYKWGLLLVKDYIENLIKNYKENAIFQFSDEANVETGFTLRSWYEEQYAEGSSDYLRIFKEVTGVTPEIYKECQTKKTSKVQYYYRLGETGSMGLCSSNPGITEINDWYYATDKDGNLIEGRIATDDTIALGVEDDRYEPGNHINTKDINNYMLRIGAVWKIPYSDVVFHYEPFKADAMDKVNSEIQKEINEKIAQDRAWQKEGISNLKRNDPVFTKKTKFCDLSSATQQYIIQSIMLGDCWAAGDGYVAYEPELAASHGVKECKGKKNPKGRVHGDDGANGLRLAYQKKWMGVCENFANLELTIYDLFGVYGEKISCSECNHAWTVAKLTNSKGQTFYADNNYGFDGIGYTAMPGGCFLHNKGIKTYKLKDEFELDSFAAWE